MKINRRQFLAAKFSRTTVAAVLPLAVSLFFAASLAGQVATPSQEEKAVPTAKEKILSEKVMEDLPHYEDIPVAVAAPKPAAETTPEIVTLVPFVIVGDKVPKLSGPELLTTRARAEEILKQSDYSAFSLFQHREDVRLEDMASLQNLADSLMLVGDVTGGREIERESNRLFLRTHDPESKDIDSLLNSRFR
jgi:hypothetical protein